MTQSSNMSLHAIAATLELSEAKRVVDIAGGRGHVLATLLAHNPGLQGVLFDFEGAFEKADPRIAPGGEFADRVELHAGDCRAEIDVEADVYLLKSILDWDDESTLRTIGNVVAAARPGDRVLFIENLVDEASPQLAFTSAMDLLLLLNVSGGKHTVQGLTDLIEKSGLRIVGMRPVDSYLSLVECVVPE